MSMVTFDLDDARKETWSYNPEGKTKEEQRGAGDSVSVILHNVPEENQLFGRISLKPWAHHGRDTAKDTCYYYVISGTVDFYEYRDSGMCTIDRQTLEANEAIKIEKGTIFAYNACGHKGAEVMLFRNYAST